MQIMFAWVLLAIFICSVSTQRVIVNTTHGRIRGFTSTILGTQLDVFYGVPYAKPPIDELRFKKPEDMPSWHDSIIDTNTISTQCMQPPQHNGTIPALRIDNSVRSEDCLYLNIWSPKSNTGKLSTMVWIHGGAYLSGSINSVLNHGEYMAAVNNVVFVSMNYRLGEFGFLYLDTKDAAGNQGMLDQVMALQWINNNVERFGGDKNKITIFGESAGSTSVCHHLFSPLSRDLFSYAIMQSGTLLAPWALTEKTVAKKNALRFADKIGCHKDTDLDILKCLKGVSAEDIVSNQIGPVGFSIQFTPLVDGTFLPDDPKRMLREGNVKNTSIIVGVVKNEATYFLSQTFSHVFELVPLPASINETHFLRFENAIAASLGGDEAVRQAIHNMYVESIVPSLRPSYYSLADTIASDLYFRCSTSEFASIYAALGNDMYVYTFDYRVENTGSPPFWGVAHSFELEAVLGHTLMPNMPFTPTDRSVSRDVMNLWTNLGNFGDFECYGNAEEEQCHATRSPNGGGSDIRWPTFNGSSELYLSVSEAMPTKQDFRHGPCVQLNKTIPLILGLEKKTTV